MPILNVSYRCMGPDTAPANRVGSESLPSVSAAAPGAVYTVCARQWVCARSRETPSSLTVREHESALQFSGRRPQRCGHRDTRGLGCSSGGLRVSVALCRGHGE